MSSRFFREALSMESEAVVEDAINPMEADLELESATVEIAEASHEVEMLDYQQEELEHAHASLESIAASLESLMASDERGLDRVAAEGYRHAVTAIVGDALPNPVASLESFGGESECAAATQLSLEGLKESIKKVWDAIKRAVTSAIKAVSDFFAKLFGGVNALEKKFKSLNDKHVKVKKDGLVPKNPEFSAPGADRLEYKGVFTTTAVIGGVEFMLSGASDSADKIAADAKAFYDKAADFYKKADKPEDAEELASEVTTVITKTKEESKAFGSILPGGKTITLSTKSDSESSKVSIPSIKVEDHPDAKKFSGEAKIAVPSLDEISTLIDKGMKLVDWMNDAKKKREAIVKARQDSVKAAESWVKAGESGKLSEAWTSAKVNGALRFAQSNMDSNLSRIDGYIFSYTRSVAAFTSSALSQYGEKKSEEKGEKKDDE